MNVPRLRFKEFTDEWSTKRICDVATVTGGGTPSTDNSKYWNGNIQWFTPSEIGKTKYISNSSRTITKDGLKNSSAKLLPIGTILLSSRATIGEASILTNVASTNQGFQSLIVDEKYNNEFIFYLKNKFQKEMLIKAFGSTFLEISKSNIENIKIILPTLNEQNKIANFLSLLDKKIELQTKKIEDLKLYKLSQMEDTFNRQCLEAKSFEDVAIINKGTQLNSEELIDDGDYYMLNGGISPSGNTNKYNCDAKTITISEGGNSCGYVNFNKSKFWCGGHCYFIVPKDVDNLYLYQNLKYNESKIMTLRVGSGLPNIQKRDLEKFKLKIHNGEDQIKIAKYLLLYDEKVDLEISKLKRLIEFKKGLMQNMFV